MNKEVNVIHLVNENIFKSTDMNIYPVLGHKEYFRLYMQIKKKNIINLDEESKESHQFDLPLKIDIIIDCCKGKKIEEKRTI